MSEKVEPLMRTRIRRGLIRGSIFLVLAYGVIVLMLMLLENMLVFRPSSAKQFWADPPEGIVCEEMYLKTTDGTKIHARWFPKQGASGTVLLFHGNGGNLSHRRQIIVELQNTFDSSVLIFDYPGYGKSSGSPSEAGCYASAEAAYHWLTVEKKDPESSEKVIFWGMSLGGGVAVEMASRHPYRALCLNRTYTSLPDVGQGQYPWVPVKWLMRNRFDNLAKLPSLQGPIIFSHGKKDTLIPFHHAESLFAAAQDPKISIWDADGDHHTPLPPEYFREAKAFLEKIETRSE